MSNRRDFLKLGGAVLAGALSPIKVSPGQAAESGATALCDQGKNLMGWKCDLGDARHAAPGEPDVGASDIETEDYTGYSEVRANIKPRVIMAHNITYNRFTDPDALNQIHTCEISFRIPYVPKKSASAKLNGQTMECGIFVWDGAKTANKEHIFDYGMAFQWLLNPWGADDLSFGAIQVWAAQDKDENPGILGKKWTQVGHKTVDTKWHTARMVVDFKRKSTSLLIDNEYYPSQFSITAKDWTDSTIDARFQVEAISIDPRPDNVIKARHKVQYKNWRWCREPAVCQ